MTQLLEQIPSIGPIKTFPGRIILVVQFISVFVSNYISHYHKKQIELFFILFLIVLKVHY